MWSTDKPKLRQEAVRFYCLLEAHVGLRIRLLSQDWPHRRNIYMSCIGDGADRDEHDDDVEFGNPRFWSWGEFNGRNCSCKTAPASHLLKPVAYL